MRRPADSSQSEWRGEAGPVRARLCAASWAVCVSRCCGQQQYISQLYKNCIRRQTRTQHIGRNKGIRFASCTSPTFFLFLRYIIDPSFCHLRTSSPIPQRQCNPGLVDVVHWEEADLEFPPEIGGRGWLERRVLAAFHTGRLPPSQGFGFAQATSIQPTPGPLSFSYHTSHSSAMV